MNTLTLAEPQVAAPPASATGDGRFFADPTFHFQTVRALMEINAGGAEGEPEELELVGRDPRAAAT